MSRPLDPRLLRTVPALRGFLIVVGGCQLLAALLTVTQVGLLASAVVTVFGQHQYGHPLVIRLVLLAAVGLARAVVAALQELVAARASVQVRAQLRRATLQAIVRLGPGWVAQQPPGRLANASGPGLDALDGYVSRALPAVVAAAVVPVVVLGRIGLADWQSGLLLVLMLPLVPLFMALVGVTTKRRVQRQYLLLTRLAGHFLDLMRGLTTLTIYGQAARQERTLRAATEQYRCQALATLKIAFLSALVLDLVAALSVAVVAVDVGLRLDSGSLSFTTALVVLFLAPELFAPLRALGVNYHANEEGSTAAAAALDVIEEASRCAEVGTAGPCAAVRADGALALVGVTIAHDDRTEPALDNVCLTVAPGEFLVLNGESGAGKSTVLAALLGFIAPTAGHVVVGLRAQASDLAELDGDAWRANLAWLPQRPVPSQQRIADEVRLGDPDADDALVDAACRACRTPPPGTALGEDGRWVSAGQRRRIALARVLLRAWAVRARGGVPVVLLDEPSEDLDRATELVVAEVISSLGGWASVVVATHSPVLSALASRRVTLTHGKVSSDVPQRPFRPRACAPAQGYQLRPLERVPSSTRRDAVRPLLRLRELARADGVGTRLAFAGALSAAAGVAGLGLTASSTWLIARAAQHPNVQALAIAVVGVRAFAISRALLRYGERVAAHDGALRLLAGLRVRVFAALRPLGPSALGGFARGDLLRRFVGDVDGVQDGLVRAFVPVCGAFVTAAAAVVLAAGLAPAAGAVLAAALVFSGVAVPWLTLRGAGDCAELVEAVGHRDAVSANVLDSIAELVAYSAATASIEEIAELDARARALTLRPSRAAAVGVLLSGCAAALALPAALFAGAAAVRAGHLDAVGLGVLAACVLVGFESIAPLPSAFASWARCRAGLNRVAAVLAAAPVMAEPTGTAATLTGRIGLVGTALTVSPAPGSPAVVDRAALRLRAGNRIAITGASGSGKSTLLTAALRLVALAGGSLAISGDTGNVALRTLRADDVPPLVAGSLQGDHVFDATLRDNLRVVKPEALDEDLDEVARRSGLLAFIDSLPGRWATPAGPDGSSLSGGQRQRLLLARALLFDPRVLVLDEPTAHLDAVTERAVLDDLLDATAGRTVLMSTHRWLPPSDVDQVLHLVGGALIDERAPERSSRVLAAAT
jgi:ATP-binding cassette subfamily C protein CydCD